MQMILLQIVSDTLKTGASAPAVTPQDMSLIDLFVKAGWIMIPLLLLSVLTVYVFVERWMAIGKAAAVDDHFMNIIRDNVVSGNIVAAKNFARNTDNPVGRMIDKGLQRIGKPLELISSSMENVAQLELFKLEKNVNVLSVVSKTAPIFGFIGTLVGLMQLFYNINATGEYELSTIAGGIYTKLISSITGLLIGMIAYLLHNILQTKVERAANSIEAAAADFMDVLQEPTRS
jgi:biopolymer transport protein ExbB